MAAFSKAPSESGGIGRRTRLRIWHFGVGVRLPPFARPGTVSSRLIRGDRKSNRKERIVKATITNPNATERVLEIEVERDRFDKIFDQKVRKYSKEVRINGFRPGNVPKDVIAKRFKDPINAESLEALVEEVLKEACKEHNIEPIAPGRIEKLEAEAGKPVLFKAVLEIDPPVEIKDYKLDIPVHPAEPSEDEIKAQLEMLRKRAYP